MWQLSLENLATKTITDIIFHFSFLQQVDIRFEQGGYDHSVRSRETIYSQISVKKFTTRQIFSQNFFTHQSLKQVCYNASDSALKILQHVRF